MTREELIQGYEDQFYFNDLLGLRKLTISE